MTDWAYEKFGRDTTDHIVDFSKVPEGWSCAGLEQDTDDKVWRCYLWNVAESYAVEAEAPTPREAFAAACEKAKSND